MKRRIFNILAAISLLLCLATAGLWIYTYVVPRPQDALFTSPRSETGTAPGRVWVLRIRARAPDPPLVNDGWSHLGFSYWRCEWERYGSVDDDPDDPTVLRLNVPPPQPKSVVVLRKATVPCWFPWTLTAILPALWLWRWNRHRRATDDGMPHCAKCDYNLTGNVSGICPECGTPIPADLVREPLT